MCKYRSGQEKQAVRATLCVQKLKRSVLGFSAMLSATRAKCQLKIWIAPIRSQFGGLHYEYRFEEDMLGGAGQSYTTGIGFGSALYSINTVAVGPLE
jgi:hypothetical protein